GFSRGKPGAPIGTGLSYASVGLEWANAADTPFRKFKIDTYEGGIATPLIAHWPKGMTELSQETPTGHVVHAPRHVIDIMPTLLDVAGTGYLKEVSGRPLLALEGRSLKPLLIGRDGAAAKLAVIDRPLFWEHQGNKAIRLGNWKAVASRGGAWELYNLAEDRTELRDTARAHPEKTSELAGLWRDWADRCGVWEWDDLQDHRRKRAESRRR
ncbi:MAG: sulfatase-like hydrolase/transferase, partial [Patescibacteria group bacterium]|nr:sulfatase-like hydrolase/transferase [Patescibacteria group bacterium]